VMNILIFFDARRHYPDFALRSWHVFGWFRMGSLWLDHNNNGLIDTTTTADKTMLALVRFLANLAKDKRHY